ncbi:hypothetical protein FO519_004470 [Halicephalobus sp. NKZ332]|nr:hypothetical protein FO519_004470 [Halicephalobus sp. NKZ332]
MDSPPTLVPQVNPYQLTNDQILSLLTALCSGNQSPSTLPSSQGALPQSTKPQKFQMNGSAIEFASNTGNGGTWQRNGNSTSNGLSQNNSNGFSMMTGFSNVTAAISFKCSECAISKSNFEELEVHIKTEHLNWLPFHCQFCNASRATDTLIREHVYSSHKRDDPKYLYVDNMAAKRKLTQMQDKALILAITAMAAKKGGSSNGVSQQGGSSVKRPRLDSQLDNSDMDVQPRASASATVTVLPKANDILAQLTAGRNDNEQVPGQIEDGSYNGGSITEGGQDDDQPGDLEDFTSNQLSQLFGNSNANLTSEFDDDFTDGSFMGTDNDSSKTLIENINALFNSQPSQEAFSPGGKNVKKQPSRGGRQINCVSKKRVLGECSRCQKPVTAGARQMHMFYHLAKDQDTYRFKCLFDNCDVQHYRKDQMENHQSKMHGRIDPEMMEDRSAQLHDTVQVLSMELLGTSGNQPGPTAERAQIAYNTMQREAAEAIGKKKRRIGFVRSEFNGDGASSPSTSNVSSPHGSRLGGELDTNFVKPEQHRNEDFIKCMLCQKTILGRTRGFHLLWHLNNDLNIVRYHCRLCDFKHDRSQSINNHGKREHGDENCCVDTIGDYDEEIRSMSKACFGVEQLFTKDAARNKKVKTDDVVEPPKLEDLFPLGEDAESTELDENEQISETHSDTSDEQKMPEMKMSPNKTVLPMKSEIKSSPITPKGESGAATKKKSNRRFGTRRPKSKKQKLEMAKLREISMVLGGAQYFRKKVNEAAICNKCGKTTQSRLTHHAYSHIEASLFECPECHLGQQSREIVVKHMKDLHNSSQVPIDNRLKYAKEIKESVRECYPEYFVDAAIPTQATIEKLKMQLNLEEGVLGGMEENQSDVEEQQLDDDDEQHEDGLDLTQSETLGQSEHEEEPMDED